MILFVLDHIDELKYDKPFLFPHGNLKTDTLRTHFSKVGIGLGEVLVYETIPNPNLRKELADTTADFTQIPEYVVFFSPSGVQSSISLIRAIDADLSLVKVSNYVIVLSVIVNQLSSQF